jgi:hypothetical protein
MEYLPGEILLYVTIPVLSASVVLFPGIMIAVAPCKGDISDLFFTESLTTCWEKAAAE